MVRRRRTNPLVFLLAAIVVIATGWWQQRGNAPAPAPTAPVPVEAKGPVETRTPEASQPLPGSGVPAAERAQLEKTLALIARGGPFPYDKDGSVFQNREGRLPPRPRGYYREYTVPTPGASNRGARRVVQGRDGDTWYTSDHYRTFVRIDE